ncbi:MAG: peptidylprolyl isomerase [Phycisphaeraceae bacterium]
MRFLFIGIMALTLTGCQSGSSSLFGGDSNAAGANNGKAATPNAGAIAYLDGRPITDNDLKAALYEAVGGQVLAELILDRRVERRLGERGITLTKTQVTEEKALLLRSLDPNNDDNAVRLLRELRRRRGLGDQRFDKLLWRNAAMRALVRDEVVINEEVIKQAFEIEHGPRYEIRLIMLESLNKASDVLRQARGEGGAAASFMDLAVKHSTDTSKVQGGLLAPVSPVDPTWPEGIRKAVTGLEEGTISDPIAMDRGFALIKLEKKIPGGTVKLADVQADLTNRLRRNLERVRMQTLARQLLADADLLVTDRTLRQSWEKQKEEMFAE